MERISSEPVERIIPIAIEDDLPAISNIRIESDDSKDGVPFEQALKTNHKDAGIELVEAEEPLQSDKQKTNSSDKQVNEKQWEIDLQNVLDSPSSNSTQITVTTGEIEFARSQIDTISTVNIGEGTAEKTNASKQDVEFGKYTHSTPKATELNSNSSAATTTSVYGKPVPKTEFDNENDGVSPGQALKTKQLNKDEGCALVEAEGPLQIDKQETNSSDKEVNKKEQWEIDLQNVLESPSSKSTQIKLTTGEIEFARSQIDNTVTIAKGTAQKADTSKQDIIGQSRPELEYNRVVEFGKNIHSTQKPIELNTSSIATSTSVYVKPAPKTQFDNENDKLMERFENFNNRNTITTDGALPSVNVKERIIFVVDRAHDETVTPFNFNNQSIQPLEMIKYAIKTYLKLKQTINHNHEYAVIALNENNASWVLPFTSDVRRLNEALKKMTTCETEDIFSLNCLFDLLVQNVELPKVVSAELPPPFIVRTILIYGRSYTIPNISISDQIKAFLNFPYYTCDVLLTHEPVGISNNCEKIFEVLQNLDTKGFAYFFPVSRDAKRLLNAMAMLLGHPLQRPIQKFSNFKMKT